MLTENFHVIEKYLYANDLVKGKRLHPELSSFISIKFLTCRQTDLHDWYCDRTIDFSLEHLFTTWLS